MSADALSADHPTGDPTAAQTADVPPATATGPAEHASHLHEMNSDQVLDEVAHQDRPELRQAALDELKTRLHADGHGSGPSASVDEPHDAPAAPIALEPAVPPASEALTSITADEVETLLNARAGDSGESLQWQDSVVDLLKLLGKDSSQQAREHYAVDLGLPQNELGELSSSELNTWLHSQLLSTLAQNGGTLPPNLA